MTVKFLNVKVHVIDGAKYDELRLGFKNLIPWEGK